jgi:predicted acyltransferase (DUF342 family)
MGISWEGSEYSLVVLPPGVFITNPPNLPPQAITQDNYSNAANAIYDIQFFNGYDSGAVAPYKYFRINNPGIGAWTYAIIENTPPAAPEPLRVYMANGSDIVLDFKSDQDRYVLTKDQNGNPVPVLVNLQATLMQGGENSGINGHTQTVGEPIDDAIVSIQVTSPDGQKGVGFLTSAGNGTYTITLNTTLTGNYDVSVIASDNVPNDTLNNSQYLITTQRSFFVSPDEEPVQPPSIYPPYPIFSNQNVTFGTSVKVFDGKVGSNAKVTVGGSSNIEKGVEGNTSFTGGTSVNIDHITFNGSVSLDGSSNVAGDINSGSSFQCGTSDIIGGNIVSGDFVTLGGSSKVNGNVDARGNVTLGTVVKIYGNLTTSGSLTKPPSSIVYGTITENGVPLAPQTYSLVTLPPPTSFSSGGANVTTSCTLNPGSYGSVNLGTSKTLNLSSGDYYFDSFSMGGSSVLNLNVGNGKIHIFVTGNVTFGTSVVANVLNGNPEDVYLETHGNFSLGGSSKWYGIIFCPSGKFTAGTSCKITGDVWTNGDISINGSCNIYCIENVLNKQSTVPQNNSGKPLTPDQIALEQNYPNPFNPTTTIRYQLPEKNHVSLQIFDILGNLISTLVNQEQEPGYYSVVWNAAHFASGVYFYRFMSGSFVSTKKLILVK